MSEENVAVVAAIYRAWANRELGREFMAEDIRFVNPPDALEPGTREGANAFTNIFEVYSDVRFDIDRLIDAGDDQVVMTGTMHARARLTGLEMTRSNAQVWTVRDGKATSMRWFHTAAEALEAAGLSK
jgi:ketosteroid isomerase-like protein